ncbi:MAG: MBL fold metallo-hydrolase, partial [Betaproteobacteria bacterium]
MNLPAPDAPLPVAVRPAYPALEFPSPVPPATGTVTPLADGVLWLRMPLPFALDHINLWLLRDGAGYAIVDCGFGSDATRAAWDSIFADHAPITRVIATHYHPDHVGLAGWLTRRWDAALWMTEAEYLTAHAVWDGMAGYGGDALARLFEAHGLDAGGVTAIGSRGNAYRRSVTDLPATFRRITDGDRIAIGANEWRVIVGYGHAPEHAALYCERLGVLISGDMLLPKISTNTSVWSTEPDGDPVG